MSFTVRIRKQKNQAAGSRNDPLRGRTSFFRTIANGNEEEIS
jgi:hypothetical protein